MRIAIVDDERRELENLSGRLREGLQSLGCSVGKIDAYCSAEELFAVWRPGEYDLIVLDIYMQGLPGIDAARRIRDSDKDVSLVFCTSGNEFASESYEVNARYYLRKPVSEESVREMLRRLRLEDREQSRFVTFPDGQKVILRNIVYTEYYNHTVTIYNKRGGELRTRISQTQLEELLCRHPFLCCCSKGIVVNFYEVAAQERNLLRMSDGKTVYISRRKEKEVLDAYTDFRFERMRKEMRE